MGDVTVSIEGDFLKLIRDSEKDLEKVIQKSLRKAATDVEKEIHRTVVANKLMDIDFKDFKKTKTLMRRTDLSGGVANMSIDISINAKAHTSYRFFPKSISKGKSKIWFGSVYGKSKRFYGGKAFQIKGKKPLFVREGKDRLPIKPVFGPNAVDLLDKTNNTNKIIEFADLALRIHLSEGIEKDFPLTS